MPISFLQPVLTFALVWSNGWEKWNSSYWDSLVVSAPLVGLRCPPTPPPSPAPQSQLEPRIAESHYLEPPVLAQ